MVPSIIAAVAVSLLRWLAAEHARTQAFNGEIARQQAHWALDALGYKAAHPIMDPPPGGDSFDGLVRGDPPPVALRPEYTAPPDPHGPPGTH